jgi:hypothetical protein
VHTAAGLHTVAGLHSLHQQHHSPLQQWMCLLGAGQCGGLLQVAADPEPCEHSNSKTDNSNANMHWVSLLVSVFNGDRAHTLDSNTETFSNLNTTRSHKQDTTTNLCSWSCHVEPTLQGCHGCHADRLLLRFEASCCLNLCFVF